MLDIYQAGQPRRERLDRPRRVIAAPVEAPVDAALELSPQWLEQRRDEER
jgi:hypothetical protein